jgi:hypothetical protein
MNGNPDPRMERARELLSQGKVSPARSPGYYLVRSQSKPVTYLVSLNPPSCTCPDFAYRNQICKHILAARMYAARKKEVNRELRRPRQRTFR